MDIAGNPVLIIAMGGTGRNIANRFRRRLRQRVGTDRLPLVEYLYVDTDQGNADAGEESDDGIAIGLATTVAADLADLSGAAARELELASWIDEDAHDRLGRGTLGGAQGFRQLGRISFLASQRLRKLNSQIQERVGNLLEARRTLIRKELPNLEPRYLKVRLQGAGPQVMIYVLASAGGGTGSSAMIDMGYFVRRALRETGYEANCKLIGICCLASTAFESAHQYRYNSAGVLVELDHYLTRPEYRAAYPLAFPGQPLHPELGRDDPMFGIASGLPFHYHYLCQPATMLGGSLDPDDPPAAMRMLEQKVAELLLSDTVFAAPPGAMDDDESVQPPKRSPIVAQVLDGEIEARRVDLAGRVRRVTYDGRYPTDFMTFGISTWEFPAAMHHVLAFGKAIRDLADRWTSTPTPPPNAGPDRLGSPAAEKELERWIKDLGLLRDTNGYAQHRSRPASEDRLLASLLTLPDTDPRQQLLAATALVRDAGQQINPQGWLSDRRGAVEQLFIEVADRPPVGQPGSLHARLRDRANLLAGWSSEGLPHQVARSLLTVAFDAEAGCGAALALADRLTTRLSLEQGHLQLCLDEPVSRDTPTGRAASEEHDWLLMGWHGKVAEPTDTRVEEEQAWQYANDKLATNVLRSKLRIMQQCLEAIDRMRRRLVNLREYLLKWRAEAPDPDDPAYALSAEERHFVLRDDSLIEQFAELAALADLLRQTMAGTALFRELIVEVERGLPEQDAKGDPALLVTGMPFDRRRNKPDFSYMEDIERVVFGAIGERRDGPYQQEIIELLQRRAALTSSAVPDLQAEASPLLMFDSENSLYTRTCQFGGDVEVWQFLSCHNSLDHDSFAAAVVQRQARHGFQDTPHTKLTSVDTKIPSVVTVVRHRIGIVTPLVTGYDPESVRRMIRTAAHSPLTDTRIQPPLDPAVLWRAGFNILGGLILGSEAVFTLDDHRFRFSYTIQDAAGFRHEHDVRLSMDFQEAHEWLARAEPVLEELDGQITAKLKELGDEAAARLEDAIARLNHYKNVNARDRLDKQLDVWAHGETASGVYLTSLDHDDALSLLTCFAVEFGVQCSVKFDHPYADFRRRGEAPATGVIAQSDGWYCRSCGHYHGSSVPPPKRSCTHCRKQRTPAVPDGGRS